MATVKTKNKKIAVHQTVKNDHRKDGSSKQIGANSLGVYKSSRFGTLDALGLSPLVLKTVK
jgi:hypothetical protein